MEKELRFQPGVAPTIETREDGSEIISGLGVVFDQRSENLGGFYEYIDKNAFDDADLSDVVGLFNHDSNIVLGRSSSGTMRFRIEVNGIYYDIDAPQTQLVRDMVLAPMRRKDITGSSFAFTTAEDGDEWEYKKDEDTYVRYVKKVKRLYDLSPVTTPAYKQTSSGVAKRSLDAFKAEFEKRQQESEKQAAKYLRGYAENKLKLRS